MKLNNKGQMILEAVLLMTVFLAIVVSISAYFRSNDTISSIVQGPWKNLAGMFQNGVWSAPTASQAIHPNAVNRHITVRGESAN